jgi:hypothetical protein
MKVYLYAFIVFTSALPALGQQKPMLLWFDKHAYQPPVFTYDIKEFKQPFYFEEIGCMGYMGNFIFHTLCDVTGYQNGRAGGCPHNFENQKIDVHLTKAKVETIGYFDVVNFA